MATLRECPRCKEATDVYAWAVVRTGMVGDQLMAILERCPHCHAVIDLDTTNLVED